MKQGKIINSLIVDDIPMMKAEDTYKYLGIIQANQILHQKVKEKAKERIPRKR